MAFCKFSTQLVANNSINIDITFLNDYLPIAPESCIKIYLFGLLKCYNATANDNSIENFENVLGYSKEDIISAFMYWQENNLVQVINVEPLEIRYLPVKNSLGILKKFKKDKYSSFNLSAQEIIEERMISPNEYNEYYSVMESLGIEQEAMLMIMKYCANTKGKNINYPYILTVAKNWAYEGIKTSKQVEEKLEQLNLINNDLSQIFKALNFKGSSTLEIKGLYLKWKDELCFDLGTILFVAKNLKDKASRFVFDKLDSKLSRYYELGLSGIKEIEDYETNKTHLIDFTRKLVNKLALQYSNVDNVIETYVLEWLKKGYSEETLMEIATYCFRKNKRDLETLDDIINKFYKLGLITTKSIQVYVGDLLNIDNKIKKIIDNHELARKVTSFDRDFYKTWSVDWNMSEDLIDYASSLSVGKGNVFQYMNKILSSWKEQKVDTLEKAKQIALPTNTTTAKSVSVKSFSSDALDTLFDTLDEVEL